MDRDELVARLDALEQKVGALEEKEEVRAVLLEYCRLNDALDDIDGLVNLFHDDAVLVNPAGRHEGKQAVRDYLAGFFARGVRFSRHHVIQPVIEITEPGVARVEAYFIALLGDGASKIAIGRYDDTLVKTDAGWRYRSKHNDVLGVTTTDEGWARGFAAGAPVAAGAEA